MTPRPADLNVLIVGAGAAGLAAARRLRAAGRTVLLLEARGRIGGRAWTLKSAYGPLDLGCGWLHSADRNPLVDEAAALGLTIDRADPPWTKRAIDRAFSEGDQRAYRQAQAEFFARLGAIDDKGPDRPASDFLARDCRWNPLLEAASGAINGVGLADLSSVDFKRYWDSGMNWRIAEGYGTFFEAWAGAEPCIFECPARRIDHSGSTIVVTADKGVFTARSVIVATPTNTLAAGAIAFEPAIPDWLDAAANLPLGDDEKLFFALEGAEEFAPDSRLFGATDSARSASYNLRPFGRPLVECFFGGALARELGKGGMSAMDAFAREEIAAALGASMRARLTPIAASSWSCDPFSLGAYSHALIGRADARAKLAHPVNERLLFAGEACSPHYFTTAHGAAESGMRAADFLLSGAR